MPVTKTEIRTLYEEHGCSEMWDSIWDESFVDVDWLIKEVTTKAKQLKRCDDITPLEQKVMNIADILLDRRT